MCQKRTTETIRPESRVTRLREARRHRRIQRMTPLPASDIPQQVVVIDKVAHNKLILELAWKTVELMQKNKIIQQKIIELQKETSEFVAAIEKNPENRQRYLDYVKAQELKIKTEPNPTFDTKDNLTIKTELKTEPKIEPKTEPMV